MLTPCGEGPSPPLGRPRARGSTPPRSRTLPALLLGQVLEFYDFLLYGSAAALVFGPLFFPTANAAGSASAALATVAVGFVVRPVGALAFGFVGDTFGRRPALLGSLALMAVATGAIGVLPTHAAAGAWAPALLVVLRVLQGISLGGEWAGAAVLAVEHAPASRRGLQGAVPQLGSPVGLVLSTAVLLGVRAGVGEQAFLAWGWRVPFLVGGVLGALGLVARSRLLESPEFIAPTADRHRLQVRAVWSECRRSLVAGTLVSLVTTTGYYLVTTFTVSHVVNVLGLPPAAGLTGLLVTAVVQAAVVLVFGHASTRVPAHRLVLLACVATAAWCVPFYGLVATGRPALIWTAQGVAMLFLAGVWALLPQLLAEHFPADVRYTGVSLCFQTASAVAGLAPWIAATLASDAGEVPWGAAALLLIAATASALGTCLHPHAGSRAATRTCPVSAGAMRR